ncbi:hypothetical protein OKW35_006062 [Paraburkholderia sp. MM5477-R1]
MPLGRYFRLLISPIGSASAATWRRPSTIVFSALSDSVNRSMNAASWPLPRARSRSRALAAFSRSASRSIASATAASAAFFAAVDARAIAREA